MIILDYSTVSSQALFKFFQPFVLDGKKLLHLYYHSAARSRKTEFNVAWPSEGCYSPVVERVLLNGENNKELWVKWCFDFLGY